MDSGIRGVDVVRVGTIVVGGGKVFQDVGCGDEWVVVVVIVVLSVLLYG